MGEYHMHRYGTFYGGMEDMNVIRLTLGRVLPDNQRYVMTEHYLVVIDGLEFHLQSGYAYTQRLMQISSEGSHIPYSHRYGTYGYSSRTSHAWHSN